MKPLTNFSKLPNHKEPEDRGKLGTWILDSDLASCFEYVQIYYNPSVYPHVKSDYYRAEQEKVNTFKPESEIIVIEEIKQEDDAEDADGHGTLQGGQQTPVQSINQPATGGNTNQGARVLVHTGSSPHVVFD